MRETGCGGKGHASDTKISPSSVPCCFVKSSKANERDFASYAPFSPFSSFRIRAEFIFRRFIAGHLNLERKKT